MQIIEYDDVTHLGRRVLFYDAGNREAGRPRAGIISGPGVEPGCVCVTAFRRESLDDNTPPAKFHKNVLLVKSVADRPPGNAQIALLVGDAGVSKKQHAEAYGGRPQDLPKAATLKQAELVLAPGNKTPGVEDENWDEATGESTKPPKPPKLQRDDDEDDGEPETPDEKPTPRSKAESLTRWAKFAPVMEVAQPKIVDDFTVDLAVEIGGDLVDFVRIKWVDGPDDSQSGYVLRLADVTGKMTMNMGQAVSFCKTETEIESLIKIAKVLISRISSSKTTDEAHHKFKAAIEDFRQGKISV